LLFGFNTSKTIAPIESIVLVADVQAIYKLVASFWYYKRTEDARITKSSAKQSLSDRLKGYGSELLQSFYKDVTARKVADFSINH